MAAIIETAQNISQTTDKLIDFLVKDGKLSADFETYLLENNVQIQKESELTDTILNYVLEGRMQDNTRVLDYFLENNPDCSDEKIVHALRNAFVSVFRINKMTKTSFETTCLLSEKDFTLVPLVKITALRGITANNFIKARVIEINNNYYLLEISEVFSSLREWEASREAVLCILRAPETPILHNKDKFLQIKDSTESFNATFKEAFNTDEIIVSNKLTDELLNAFYLYHTGEIETIPEIPPYEAELKFFDIKEFQKDIVENACRGFNTTDETYDTGLFADKDFGIFVIPFLGCVNKILAENSTAAIENGENCLLDFLKNRKNPINLIKKKAQEFPALLELAGKIAEMNFEKVEAMIEFFRPDSKEIQAKMGFSPVMVLYNSKAFSKLLNKKEEEKKSTVGRNDPCPCGSGKKYKKCCLNKS